MKDKITFFLIHGYTGSPTDFGELSNHLKKKFKAHVIAHLLPGHGTKVSDLNNLKLEDFINFIDQKYMEEKKKSEKIILIGSSFGAQLALYLAGKYGAEGVILCSASHKLKFPFNIPFGEIAKYLKKDLPKYYHPNELELRKHAIYYTRMPTASLGISKELKKKYTPLLKNISCPFLSLYAKGDKIGHYKSSKKIFKKINSKKKNQIVFNMENHNLFYSEIRDNAIREIISFIEENIVSNNKKKIVSCIIPSYNEGERISNVLKIITKCSRIDEIIVIDDGSMDNTKEIVSKFKKVKYYLNEKNMGKGYSMDRGVNLSKGEIIFFSDADLVRLKVKHIEEIISPVLNDETDMSIGIRGNFMQKSVKLFAINSGERALKRSLWENLPKYYKYRYRIEAGLNYFSKKYGKGFVYKQFDYSQTLKEKKYGLVKGTILRWKMNFNVLGVYVYTWLFERFITLRD